MGARDPKPAAPNLSAADAAFLQKLGERVREARARRGMTRRILARDSRVSERYLAQLETGQGNVSVLLLRQIGAALGIPLNDLLRDDDDDQPVELTLIQQFLRRLPKQRLARIRAQLLRDFGSPCRSRQTHRAHRPAWCRQIHLARRWQGCSTCLSWSWTRRSSDAGISLSEIFLLYGQQGYVVTSVAASRE
jgi:XRE family aerobic/anaerobic benzoate catabolism transcriptional regulator